MSFRVSLYLFVLGFFLVSCGTTKTITGEKKKRTYTKGQTKTDYPAAIKAFTKQLSTDPNNVKTLVDRGNAYYAIKEYARSELDFKHALSIDPNFSNKVYLYQATVQRLQEKHKAAADSYAQYLKTCDQADDSCKRADRYQKEASFAADAVSNPVDFDPTLLAETINTTNSQYLPHFTIDGNKMIYTERIGNQEDLYMSYLKDGKLSKGKPIDGLNTPYNEGAHCITPDGKQIIFTVCDGLRTYGSCDLFFSSLTKNGWTKPKNLGKGVNSQGWDSQPSISGDGKKLYFSSKRPGGYGGSDLYVASVTDKGWGDVVNLGENINSYGNDESPFIHQDDRTLYFRSNGHIGMGDYDIFVARRETLNDSFDDVKNIGYPINSAGDEGGLYVSLDGSTGYFASDKSFYQGETGAVGKKNLDIYSFDLPVSAKPSPVSYFKTKVINGNTGLEVQALIKILDIDTGKEYLTKKTSEGIDFLVPVPLGKNYLISVTKKGYLYHSENFASTDQHIGAKPMEKTIEIFPIEVEETTEIIAESKPIILNNIFFETGSAILKSESTYEITNLANQLRSNTSLRIKILGHTDNVGSDTDNQKLSEARAKSVYDALMSKGVSASKLAYEGRGETQPIADNDTNEGRQRNRRTEFVVLGV